MKTAFTRSAVAVLLLAAAVAAQVGKPLPEADFKDFARTGATQFSDFEGRLILIEVFAYW